MATKTTRELKTDDLFAGGPDPIEVVYEVWTDPVETDNSNGRLAFMAKNIETGEVIEHQCQPEWTWHIR